MNKDYYEKLREIADKHNEIKAAEIADEQLCLYTIDKMKARLDEKREEKNGWWDESICTSKELRLYLQHIMNNDGKMIDIVNLAAMIMFLEDREDLQEK